MRVEDARKSLQVLMLDSTRLSGTSADAFASFVAIDDSL